MFFYILNILLAIFLIADTSIAGRIEGKLNEEPNPVIANILILAVTVVLFSLFSMIHRFVTPDLLTLMMKFCFMLEACFLVNLVFCFTYYGWGYSTQLTYFVKMIFYITAGYFIFFRINSVTVDLNHGLIVRSDYIFSGEARKMFAYRWYDVYNSLFKILLPLAGVLMMLIRNESHANKLNRHKGYIYTISLVLTWAFMIVLNHISSIYPPYSILYYFSYVPLIVLAAHGSWTQQVPSRKALIAFFVKSFFIYIVPSVVLGFLFMFIFNLYNNYGIIAAVFAIVVLIGIVMLGSALYKPLRNSKLFKNTDYAQAFEKDLASVDYNGEMDDIAQNMFNIFNKNVEASSFHVYINAGNATFQNAYTSNGKKTRIDSFEPLFEALLNIGRNIVAYSELETVYILGPYQKELSKFFAQTESDVLFILNEGRDVHGVILVGLKAGTDHYDEKDIAIFNKLYSYLFVFGYFMRNISNKEVIGTVNRELRMSAQIITSIQENIDTPATPQVDTGCIMIPAHNIGGEFVDMIRLTETRHLFVMGSLSGKGIAASMNMVILKSIIRAYLAETHDFKTLIVKVNQFIRYNLQKGSIFSGMFAIIDFETDTFYYVNCGIPVILLYTEAYNNVIEIEGAGHILGFVHDISPYITVKQNKLNKNDIILASTSGLIESHSLRGEQFGKDRIQRCMIANTVYPAQRISYFEHDELMRFMSHDMENDVTVLVIKYLNTHKGLLKEKQEEAKKASAKATVAPAIA